MTVLLAWLTEFSWTVIYTVRDVLPITAVILGFQLLVIRKPIINVRQTAAGYFYVIIGLALFLIGLEKALFPLGELMAQQLTSPELLFGHSDSGDPSTTVHWQSYLWVYLFAAAIGFATTLAEPSLLAVAMKAEEVSGGSIRVWPLRIAVSIGVSSGLAVGTFRIVTGTPLHYYIIAGYVVVVIQTIFAPKLMVGLAYDSGGVTTSTVTVPLVAALGLGLASNVPGRSVLIDGFGLIAFASLFPIIAVLAYAQITEWVEKRANSN